MNGNRYEAQSASFLKIHDGVALRSYSAGHQVVCTIGKNNTVLSLAVS